MVKLSDQLVENPEFAIGKHPTPTNPTDLATVVNMSDDDRETKPFKFVTGKSDLPNYSIVRY